MKQILLILCVCLGLVGAASSAADMNPRLNVLDLVFGGLWAEWDFALSDAWMLGPSFGGVRGEHNDYSTKLGFIGASAMYSLNGKALTTGWYLNPGIQFYSLKVTRDDAVFGHEAGQTGGSRLSFMAGYQWFWPGGFNLTLGGGLGASSTKGIDLKTGDGIIRESYSKSTFGTRGDFALDGSLGWAF